MRLSLLLAAAAAAAALLIALLARDDDGGAREASIPQPSAAPGPTAPAVPLERPDETPAREVEALEPSAAPPAAAPAFALPLSGVALDTQGAPVAGVGLAAATDGAGAEPRARTAADGAFAFEVPRALGELVSTD